MKSGLEMMDDKKAILIEKVKNVLSKWCIIQMNFLKQIFLTT